MAGCVRRFRFRDGKSLILGERTLVMGILNVTPDSFSDGGRWNRVDLAAAHMEQMVADGADIIDIGAESSRPGAHPLSAEKEIRRLRPFLEALLPLCPVPVSVDTFRAKTAEMAAGLGVHLLNDIWGLQHGEEPGAMARVAAEAGLPVVAMHNQEGTAYRGDIIASMQAFFRNTFAAADRAGLSRESIIIDPGIGFGKAPEANLVVLHRLAELKEMEGAVWPMLLGPSRKSFIGHALGLPLEERMEATGAACVMGILAGADIVRVHDVKPIARMCRMADAIRNAGSGAHGVQE